MLKVHQNSKIKVLIVDDSAIVRKILGDLISAERDMEVVGTAPDAYVALERIVSLRPDVLTLDIEMPGMDGLTFLKHMMQLRPVPTIIVSSLGQASCAATFEALRCGAVDVIAKPAGPHSVADLRQVLAARIRGAAEARPRAALDPAAEGLRLVKPPPLPGTAIDPQAVIAI
ncbi:MAG TPA: response regulator, partial [Acidobacteriaceae bacterium]|nr:response regulator [Acidobacteriaceae bacterium]